MRHPVYFFTVAAWMLAARLVLDRLILSLSALIYLQVWWLLCGSKVLRVMMGEDVESFRSSLKAGKLTR